MKIQPTNFEIKSNRTTNFKAAYPVYHWLAEADGIYLPVVSPEISNSLQKILIKILNGKFKSIESLPESKKIVEVIQTHDGNFKSNRFARSYKQYYDRYGKAGVQNYLITGNDAEYYSENIGAKYGRQKAEAGENLYSINAAKSDYLSTSDNFVNGNTCANVYINGELCALYTKFITFFDKKKKEIIYILQDVKFMPKAREDELRTRIYKYI